MKISNLISILHTVQEEYGDIDVVIDRHDDNEWGDEWESIRRLGDDDVSIEEALDAYSIGYYGSFVERDADHEDDGAYSGNQYEGSNMFEAIVINPPNYVDAIRV